MKRGASASSSSGIMPKKPTTHALPPRPNASGGGGPSAGGSGGGGSRGLDQSGSGGGSRASSSLPPRPSSSSFPSLFSRASSTSSSANSSSSQRGNYQNRNKGTNNTNNNAVKRSFITSYNGLVETLARALVDDSLRIPPILTLEQAAREKLLKAAPAHASELLPFLPSVSENGLLLSAVKRLITAHVPKDYKPFWLTRHHSGGFVSFICFFPNTFRVIRGGRILQSTVLGAPAFDLVDNDRLLFASDPLTRMDAAAIFDDYEARGFDPPLPVSADLPFDLVPCSLPKDFKIVYGTSKSICDTFVREHMVESIAKDGTWIPKPHLALGFDTETTQQYFQKADKAATPCLLQISTHTACLLVHQSAVSAAALPESIIWLLNHPRIAKVCVSAAAEVQDLAKFAGVHAQGFVEISDAARGQHMGGVAPWRATQLGLSTLAATYLGLKMRKPRAIQVGNWKGKLSEAQMAYAATDAWISLVSWRVLQVPGRPGSDSAQAMEGDVPPWWVVEDPVRRVAVTPDMRDKWGKKLQLHGFELVHAGADGVEVYAERGSKRVDSSIINSFYE
ncbi:hypothetical protein BC830DRAFT_1164246 [Chytriomyces sp. MP71]|nr:hypothetical protein BC830DRAFT_1164246 [Chytriomyces sp. MP71]